MLRYLLDEQISPAVAEGVRRKDSRIWIECLQRWRDGEHLGCTDADVLRVAASERLTLVSYDLRTIPGLLRAWEESEISHGGVIYVRRRLIAPNEIGKLVSALVAFWRVAKSGNWKDRVAFLPPD